jgi:hypothetical protein
MKKNKKIYAGSEEPLSTVIKEKRELLFWYRVP